jgi:hypothetical protein
VLAKISSTTDNWYMHDSSRSPYNVSNEELYANLSNAESTASGNGIDLLSNGFKIRGTSNSSSGQTYIYMAFASNPLKHSLAR